MAWARNQARTSLHNQNPSSRALNNGTAVVVYHLQIYQRHITSAELNLGENVILDCCKTFAQNLLYL